jgi:hypothetical protein
MELRENLWVLLSISLADVYAGWVGVYLQGNIMSVGGAARIVVNAYGSGWAFFELVVFLYAVIGSFYLFARIVHTAADDWLVGKRAVA